MADCDFCQSVDTTVMDLKMEEIVSYVNSIKDATESMADALSKVLKAERDVSNEMVSNSEHFASLGWCFSWMYILVVLTSCVLPYRSD